MGRGGTYTERTAPTNAICTMSLNEITIEITQQCPNQCVHCSSLSSINKTFCLSLNKVINLIDEASELGCRTINLSGGEPFVHPEITKIVEHIFERRLQCYIYTSGICLVEGKPKTVSVKTLETLKGKVTKYIVNVEAANEETYNNVMGTSFHGFDMMKQFVHNAVKQGELVEAHFVPMKSNYRQIPDVVKMCMEMGVSRVSFLRFVPQGRGLDNEKYLKLSEEELVETRRLMAGCERKNATGVRMGIPFHGCSKRINCMTSISKLNIRYDGNVYPCEAFKNDQPIYISHAAADNVYNKSLKDIYSNSIYLQQIRDLLDKYQSNETSETCMAQYLSNKKSVL